MDLKGLKFTKMHGLGNDYIVIDESKEIIIPEDEKEEVTISLCKRGFSVGADGVIFVTPSETEDIRFRIFNADGSEAEMCGNGIRCFTKFVFDNKIVDKERISVETLGGTKTVDVTVENGVSVLFKVDMGLATFKSEKIPMKTDYQEFINEELPLKDENIKLTAINVGNPHTVSFIPEVGKIDLNIYGPLLENHESFPERINVHFADVVSKDEINMITWERGAGITYACGTGATSVAISGFKLGLTNKKVLIHLPGGDLNLEVYQSNGSLGAFMEGTAKVVYNGEIV